MTDSTLFEKFKSVSKQQQWLLFSLIVGLLIIWLYTRAEMIETLLTMVVGGFLALTKAAPNSEG